MLWLLLMLGAGPLVAQDGFGCGEAEACEVEGGAYHAALPDGPVLGAVLYLHGYGGTGGSVVGNDGLTGPLLDRGYAVIAPSGLPIGPGRSGGRWNAMVSPDWRDDVAFIRRAVDDAATRFDLPRDRVLAAGFSGGGMMAWRLACDAPEAFAAYAPVAGLLWRPLPEACAGPVQMLHVHGWTDRVVPIEGRSVAGGRLTQGDLFHGLDLMRAAMGCGRDDPDRYDRVGEVLLRYWDDCAPGGALALGLHPGGHGAPAGWSDLALDWFEGAMEDWRG